MANSETARRPCSGQPWARQHQGDVQRVIWLDRGALMMRGEPDEVVKAYLKFVKVKKRESAMEDI